MIRRKKSPKIRVIIYTFVDESEKGTNDKQDVNDKMDAEHATIACGKVFVCKMCDFKARKKFDMTTHLEDIHNWYYICFSTFNKREGLMKHIKNHSK